MVIFFDIDDTLIDSESAHVHAIKTVGIQDGIACLTEDNCIEWLAITNKYLKQFFENKLSLEQQRISRIMEFWNLYGKDISETKASKLYKLYHHFFLNSCTVFPDIITTLTDLSIHHKLGIISNGVYSDQIFKLKNNNIIHFFDEIIISQEVGIAKPNKEIFLFASEKVQESPSDCIYVGDSYNIDYRGSSEAGMHGILLDRKNTFSDVKDKISFLSEIKNKLL